MNIHLKSKHPFWLKDGRKLESLRELHDALRTMTPDVFEHHANAAKNDFASWIEHSVGHPTLAGKLKTADRPQHIERIGEALAPQRPTPEMLVRTATITRATPQQPLPRKVIVSKKVTQLTISTPPQPIISRRKTELSLSHEPHRIVTPHKTELALTAQHKRIQTGHTTPLKLTHETEHHPHPRALAIISYISLGIVAGAGIFILFLAL